MILRLQGSVTYPILAGLQSKGLDPPLPISCNPKTYVKTRLGSDPPLPCWSFAGARMPGSAFLASGLMVKKVQCF